MMKLPPHKHKASDIVETKDDYLLPYLRALRDPSKIERAVIEGSEPLPEGTEFPTEPYDMQFFRLTQDIEGYPAALYRYDAEEDKWVRLQILHFEGTTEPTGIDFLIGDTFWHTADLKFYKWNGTDWIFTGAAFSVDEHSDIEHLASMLNQAVQPYNSNITFARKAGLEHNAITYTAGEVKFQDGTARSITPAAELTSLPVGNNYIYFKLDSAELFATTSHATAISADRGLLAIIIVASASNPDIPCAIQPFYAKGLNVTADTMSVILLSAISAYLGNVEIADGAVLLGDDGILVGDGAAVLDSSGITFHGAALWFYDNALYRGQIYASYFEFSDDLFVFNAPNASALISADLDVLLYPGRNVIPYQSGIKLGTVTDPWDEVHADDIFTKLHFERSNLAGRPDASAELLGTGWATRETDEEEIFWFCGLNAAGAPIWIELIGAGGDMLKSIYDQNDDGVVDDSYMFDGFLKTAFGILSLSRTWTGTQTFAHATPIKLNDIMERTSGHGVDIDGVLLKDGLVELAAIPDLPTSKITSGQFSLLQMPRGTDGYVLTGTGVGSNPAYEAVTGDMLKSVYDTNDDGVVEDSYKFDGFLQTAFGILSLSRSWSGTQTFAHATPIKLNDIMERTSGHGVDIDGVLLKDGLVELAAIPSLPTSRITSGQFSLTRMPRAASGLFLEGGGAGSNPLWNALIAANIPSLDTSKITTGTFNELRIPDIRADVKTSKPTADATNLGRIYIVRSGSGIKSKVYICVLNDANGYEWIQIGVST